MQPPPAGAAREALIELSAEYIRDGIGSGAHPAEIADFRISWLEELRERYGGEVADAIYGAGYQQVYGELPSYLSQARSSPTTSSDGAGGAE